MITSIFFLFISSVFSAMASIILKYPERVIPIDILQGPVLSKIAAIGFYGAGFVMYSLGLKYIDVSRGYPIMVSFCVILLVIAGITLGESITTKNAIGVLLLLISIYLISDK